ncbi:MAG: aminopeptidase [Bdellovibrionales bacterium]|nr:aminopeptidase [Bdellovibrionales bacterium]
MTRFRPRPAGVSVFSSRVVLLLALLLAGCSPTYVMRAGWEEAKILWNREDIAELIADPDTDPMLRHKLTRVLAARAFSKQIGLTPDGAYTQYSEIDRDVLVWVLSASPSIALASYTWWFPIVGRVPYKGFFEKEDGMELARSLQEKGYDILLRPSPAFSTLGWFDDPLLSTLVRYDEVALVNTVIHEILHSTVWIPGHAAFNETLANVVGSVGARQFYADSEYADAELAATAENRWHDELLFARFLHDAKAELEAFYNGLPEDIDYEAVPEDVLERRKELFGSLKAAWQARNDDLRTDQFRGAADRLNNAAIVAQLVYLDRPWLFQQLLEKVDHSLPQFVAEIRLIREKLEQGEHTDPFDALSARLNAPTAEAAAISLLSAKADQ